jgi:hypothetical protein
MSVPPQSPVIQLLLFVIYPLWLMAGAVDYWCHRRTNITATSGVVESLLHVAQFATIAILFAMAVLLQPTVAMIVVITLVSVLHLVLSYVDVAYTQRKRYISPLEQHAHGFLDVLPIAAVCLLAILALSDPLSDPAAGTGFVTRLEDLRAGEIAWLLGSFAIIAGGPVIEEFLRTATGASSQRKAETVASLSR